MAISNDNKILAKELPKIELDYPCNWNYKVISTSKETLKKAVLDVILERPHTMTFSHNSKTGKYISMNLELLVQNEDERNLLFQELKKHHDIKMVL